MLNTVGYYDGLAAFLDHAVEEGFHLPEQRAKLVLAADPEDLLAKWSSAVPELGQEQGLGQREL